MTIKEETAEEEKIQAPDEEKGGEETEARKFPDVFYCPLTKALVKEPVVTPEGVTYEKAAIVETGDVPSDKLYLNRSLQAIMDETISTSGTSLRAGLLRMQKSVRQSISQVLEKSALPSADYRPLPDSYYCTITFQLMHDPVIDPDGNTYEGAAIRHWIENDGKSPITRTPVTVDQLYPNNAIADLLEEEKNRGEDSIHPSIRKWKEEEPPSEFPSTEEQLEELQAEQVASACTLIGCLLVFVLIVVACMYGFGLLILWILILLCCCCGLCDNDDDT